MESVRLEGKAAVRSPWQPCVQGFEGDEEEWTQGAQVKSCCSSLGETMSSTCIFHGTVDSQVLEGTSFIV